MANLAQNVAQLKIKNSQPKEESLDFPEYRGLSFEQFWHALPHKLEYFDYEEELTQDLEETKHLWIKKCAGLGVTEYMLRWVAWKCLKDDEWRNKQVDIGVVLITGPRLDLAIIIMQRLKALFPEIQKTKETVCILNGVKIQAFPSHHVASAHGLNPIFILMEEGDLFPINQQYEAREVAERYISKTNPWIVWVSTPYLPGGLYQEIEEEEDSIYRKKIMLLDRALSSGRYTQEEVEKWSKSKSFMREAWGEYGFGVGDVFVDFDDIIQEEYDLSYTGGRAGTYADPGFGSSRFGKISAELREDGLIYVTEAEESERSSPSVMVNAMQDSWNLHQQSCKVDGANAGFIKDLNLRGIPALGVAFGETVPETEGSNTTITLKKKLPLNASSMVENKLVRIHPRFKDLISQMRAVKFDKMGGIDKSELPFDLVDAFDMMLWDMQTHDYTSIGFTMAGDIIGQDKPKSNSVRMNVRVVE